MKILEIIHLRAVHRKRESLIEELYSLVNKVGHGNGPARMELYCHAKVDNDLSVHLVFENEGQDPRASDLAQRLASAFREFGPVSHSIWLEPERKPAED